MWCSQLIDRKGFFQLIVPEVSVHVHLAPCLPVCSKGNKLWQWAKLLAFVLWKKKRNWAPLTRPCFLKILLLSIRLWNSLYVKSSRFRDISHSNCRNAYRSKQLEVLPIIQENKINIIPLHGSDWNHLLKVFHRWEYTFKPRDANGQRCYKFNLDNRLSLLYGSAALWKEGKPLL